MNRATLSFLLVVAFIALCSANPASELVQDEEGKSITTVLTNPAVTADVAGSIAAYKRLMLRDNKACYVCTPPCGGYYCCDGAQCAYINGVCYCLV